MNFILSFFLIKASEKLCRESVKTGRVLLGCALGGVYSLAVFLPQVSSLLSFSMRLLFLVCETLVVFGFFNAKRFLRLFGVLSAVTFLFAGAVLALWLLFKPQGLVIKNGTLYFDISFLTLVTVSAAIYAAVRLFGRFLLRCNSENTDCTAEIDFNGKTIKVKGIIDTGNKLTDSFTGKKVNVISRSAVLSLLETDTAAELVDGKLPVGMHLTVSDTVGGTGLLPVFTADRMCVICADKKVEIEGCAMAISSQENFGGNCLILVNSQVADLFEQEDEHDKKAFQKNKSLAFEKTE